MYGGQGLNSIHIFLPQIKYQQGIELESYESHQCIGKIAFSLSLLNHSAQSYFSSDQQYF